MLFHPLRFTRGSLSVFAHHRTAPRRISALVRRTHPERMLGTHAATMGKGKTEKKSKATRRVLVGRTSSHRPHTSRPQQLLGGRGKRRRWRRRRKRRKARRRSRHLSSPPLPPPLHPWPRTHLLKRAPPRRHYSTLSGCSLAARTAATIYANVPDSATVLWLWRR